MKLDIVITGVGGQGAVLASRVIAQTAMRKGFAVRTSETIGMAQREGPVVSHVRIGDSLDGALIPDRGADILLSFELAESVRGLQKLKPGGVIIANTAKVVPVSVALGISTYAEKEILAALEQAAGKLVLVDAAKEAKKAGNPKTVNVVLLGVLSSLPDLPFTPADLLASILESVPEKVKEVNRQAFLIGSETAEVS